MKKTIGCLMVALGSLFGIGFVGTYPKTILQMTAQQEDTAYVLGYVGSQIVILVVAYQLIIHGLRLYDSKVESSKRRSIANKC